MNVSQLNALCAAYSNVDGMSIHSASGTDDSSRIGTAESLSWGAPSGGVMTAVATFEDVTGTPRYVRVWDGAVFVEEFAINGGRGVEIVAQDVTVAIQHRVRA